MYRYVCMYEYSLNYILIIKPYRLQISEYLLIKFLHVESSSTLPAGWSKGMSSTFLKKKKPRQFVSRALMSVCEVLKEKHQSKNARVTKPKSEEPKIFTLFTALQILKISPQED